MLNTFDKKDESEKAFMEMKHHLTNFGLMGLLIALLAVPMTGFYILDYSDFKSDGLQIPDYIPVTILNNSEVLSENSVYIQETSGEVLNAKELALLAKETEAARIAAIDKSLRGIVLGSSDEISATDFVNEASEENSPAFIQPVEIPGSTPINSTQKNQAEDFEFDPSQYQPANIYPVYR